MQSDNIAGATNALLQTKRDAEEQKNVQAKNGATRASICTGNHHLCCQLRCSRMPPILQLAITRRHYINKFLLNQPDWPLLSRCQWLLCVLHSVRLMCFILWVWCASYCHTVSPLCFMLSVWCSSCCHSVRLMYFIVWDWCASYYYTVSPMCFILAFSQHEAHQTERMPVFSTSDSQYEAYQSYTMKPSARKS